MLGFVQLLRGDDAVLDAAQRQRWLGHIDGAGRHLLALIDDVLELSRAESGADAGPPQDLALAPLIEGSLQMLAKEAADAQVQLHCAALDGQVRANALRLRQVLINLLSNAIKYNHPGGSVRVWTAQRGAQWAVHVADSGRGIAADRLQQAFEPFNRLGAEADGVAGSGLGLAIVKVLVAQMGGSVDVRSTLGLGSEFIVSLPAADPATAALASTDTTSTAAAAHPAAVGAAVAVVAPTAPVPGQGAARPSRLLYIEDNPVNALLMQELMAGRPAVDLVVAGTGSAGVQSACDWMPDLILVDLQLPDMDGLAVLQALRSKPRTSAIPCVVLSANATSEDRQTALAAGFVDYWTKPFDFGRFLLDLARLLGHPV